MNENKKKTINAEIENKNNVAPRHMKYSYEQTVERQNST